MAERLLSAWSKRINLPEERPPQPGDFGDEDREASLRVLQNPLTVSDTLGQSQLPRLLILVCEHLVFPPRTAGDDELALPQEDWGGDDMLWSSPEHGRLAEKTLNQILTAEENVASFIQLIDTKDLLKNCLNLLRPRLEVWAEHPGSCHCLAVLVLTASGHHALSDNLGLVLPTILRWLDSWLQGPRILGALLAAKVLLEVPPSQLTRYGRDAVLHHALRPLLSAEESKVVRVGARPLVEVVRIMVKNKEKGQVTAADHLVEQAISRICMESNLEKKHIYSLILAEAVKMLDVGVYRWVSRLSELLTSELAVPAAHCRVLVHLWAGLCVGDWRDACARESARLLPGLVQLAWRWSYGDINAVMDREDILAVLKAQVGTDPATAALMCRGLSDVKVNEAFHGMMTEALGPTFISSG